MKIVFIYVHTQRQPWFEEALKVFFAKIDKFFSFEIKAVISNSSAREDRPRKMKMEGNKILSQLKNSDLVLAFDEKGRCFKNSRDFSSYLVRKVELGKSRMVIVIGGAFGLGEEVKNRADDILSLGPLTMNHQLAAIVCLEQIYRGLTIWKGMPYHND